MKNLKYICLFIWGFELFYAVAMCVTGEPIKPILFVLATLTIVLNYLKDICGEE